MRAYRAATGAELPAEASTIRYPDPDAGWDFDDRTKMERRLPRLIALCWSEVTLTPLATDGLRAGSRPGVTADHLARLVGIRGGKKTYEARLRTESVTEIEQATLAAASPGQPGHRQPGPQSSRPVRHPTPPRFRPAGPCPA